MLDMAQRAIVTAAVTRAESGTDGEIATIVAERSDDYGDIAIGWAVAAAFLLLAVAAGWPAILTDLHAIVAGGWESEFTERERLTTLLVLAAASFAIVRLALLWHPLRWLLAPGPVKTRRVHRAALRAFRIGTEQRTVACNGVLLYLSLAEHRAEIIADSGIHGRVAAEEWGEAMAALLAGVKAGRPGEGMAAAVERIGAVLAAHFPRTGTDPNEMPDRMVQL